MWRLLKLGEFLGSVVGAKPPGLTVLRFDAEKSPPEVVASGHPYADGRWSLIEPEPSVGEKPPVTIHGWPFGHYTRIIFASELEERLEFLTANMEDTKRATGRLQLAGLRGERRISWRQNQSGNGSLSHLLVTRPFGQASKEVGPLFHEHSGDMPVVFVFQGSRLRSDSAVYMVIVPSGASVENVEITSGNAILRIRKPAGAKVVEWFVTYQGWQVNLDWDQLSTDPASAPPVEWEWRNR